MYFTGKELRRMIVRSAGSIELRNIYGRCARVLSNAEALLLDMDLFVGVGNRRRLRFLRPLESDVVLNNGSHTTRRLKLESGTPCHQLIREHRPVRGV
jgi:hypothetical protein